MQTPIGEITRPELISFLKYTLNLKYHNTFKLNSMRQLVKIRLEEELEKEAIDRAQRKLAKLIYKAWYDAQSNPYHRLGKKRLLREFHEM
jgi:hypothetical protein